MIFRLLFEPLSGTYTTRPASCTVQYGATDRPGKREC